MNGGIFIRKYISDVVDMDKIKPGQLNLITGGCGSGKTTFVLEDLLGYFPNVMPEEMIIVTSRSITVDQMESDHNSVQHYDSDDEDIIRHWSDADHDVENPGVRVMTYDKIVDILRTKNYWGMRALANIKILVFDECHTLFTDTFIEGIGEVTVWLREAIFSRSEMIVIWITATPKVLELVNSIRNKLPVVRVMPENLITYRANHLICTNFVGAIDLLRSGKLGGRNIVMCKRIEECKIAYEVLDDSGIVVSQSHNLSYSANSQYVYGRRNCLHLEYEKYMDTIRNYVGANSSMPKYIYTASGRRMLNTLLTTSTFREGFNLVETSGVRNVFVVATDEMQIAQFLGRCRYDVDNLVVVMPPKEYREETCCGYFAANSDDFERFITTGDCTWFDSISSLVKDGIADVEFYGNILECRNDRSGYNQLKKQVIAKHILDEIKDLISDKNKRVYIWRGHHDMEVCAAAVETGLFRGAKLKETNVTLNRVMVCLQECGYRVEVFRKLPDGTRKKCYCIYRD